MGRTRSEKSEKREESAEHVRKSQEDPKDFEGLQCLEFCLVST